MRVWLIAVALLTACSMDGSTKSEAVLRVGDADLSVEVAQTDEQRQQGLMGREELAGDSGMVFLFGEPHEGGFWMKDTLIPLSIAFWDEDGRVVTILDMEPCEADPCPTYDPGKAYTGAVEVNRGWFEENGVEVGDTARFIVR